MTGTSENQLSKATKLLAYASVWIFLWLLTSSQLYSAALFESQQVQWWRILFYQMPFWFLWGILGLFVGRLSKHFPIERKSWKKNLLIQTMACLSLAIIVIFIMGFTRWFFPLQLSNMPSPLGKMLVQGFFGYFHLNVLIYWAILGINHAFDYYRKFRVQQLTSVQLEDQLKQAQLNALQMQLQPHFLFNTLHSISVLARKHDSEKVVEMIAGLGDLLRRSLKQTSVQEVSLQHELEFTKKYLSLEQIRFQDRLRISYSIAPETLLAKVPNLILQPIVENAIKHGISGDSDTKLLEIIAKKQDNTLVLEVRDNGVGLPKDWETKSKTGVGITNTKVRLKSLYNSSQKFELNNLSPKGTQVVITIPFHLR